MGRKGRGHAVHPDFDGARQRLLDWRNQGRAANEEDLFGIVGKTTIKGMLNESKGHDQILPASQTRLIYAWRYIDMQADAAKVAPDGADAAYQQIATLIGQSEANLKRLRETFHGHYRYFRYHAKTADAERRLVSGRIYIPPSSTGAVTFEHRSWDWKEEGAEHTGRVFLRQGKLFMLGGRDGVLRLSVSSIPDGFEPREGAMQAIVLSVRSGSAAGHRPPFSAKALLFHEDCPGLKDVLEAYESGNYQDFDAQFPPDPDYDSIPFMSL